MHALEVVRAYDLVDDKPAYQGALGDWGERPQGVRDSTLVPKDSFVEYGKLARDGEEKLSIPRLSYLAKMVNKSTE